jgi:hypothetical protein
MADWTVLFSRTLSKYQEEYVAFKGDEEGRASVLKKCKAEILASPKDSNHSIELPVHLLLVTLFCLCLEC